MTIVIRACNAAQTIALTIRSILGQTHKDFILWVLENGSSDKTAEIVRGIQDPRLHLFELGPVGLRGVLKYALEHTQTEWVKITDADDLWFPAHLEEQLKVLSKYPNAVLVGTAYALLTPQGHIFEKVQRGRQKVQEITKSDLVRKKYFADGSVMFSREKGQRCGVTEDHTLDVDFSFFYGLLADAKGCQINKPLYLYRLMPESHSRNRHKTEAVTRTHLAFAPEMVSEQILEARSGMNSKPLWGEIGYLELHAGDKTAVMSAADALARSGFSGEAKYLRKFLHPLFPIVSAFLRFKNRYRRHRPDWEKMFRRDLKVKSLSLFQ